MKTIELRRMHIENFKGLTLVDLKFGTITNIVGKNGAGKTSLHDAYLWTLTGEDSNECTNFKVQPLEADGKTLKKVKTSVELEFDINGETHTFCRELEQQWSTPRGTSEEVQGSNLSTYFVDGMPKKYTEYKDFVKVLFCDIENFKLMSSLTAFCNLETKTRRRKLLEMAGEMPDIITSEAFPNLYPLYVASKDIEGIKKMMNFDRSKLEAEKASIPDKITENERNLPEGIDFEDLRSKRAKLEKELEGVDSILHKSSSTRDGIVAEINAKKQEIFQIEVELTEIDGQLNREIFAKKDELGKKWIEKKGDVSVIEQKMNMLESKKSSLNVDIAALDAKKADLVLQWKTKNAEEFDTVMNDTCPTCGRKFTAEELVSMKNDLVRAFNAGKAKALKEIADQGNEVHSKIDAAKASVVSIEGELEQLKKDKAVAELEVKKIGNSKDAVPTLEYMRLQSVEYQNLLKKIDEKKASLTETVPAESDEEKSLKERKQELLSSLKEIDMMLGQEVMIAKVAARRDELHKEDVALTEKIAKCSAVLSEIKEYEKENMLAVESKVSSMFRFVKWKMYEKNLTNDGEKEICECVVDGVPYSTNLNTAKVVNAGIDIVNAVSKWLGIVVPVWVDGKESVTELIPTDSQLITLSVMEGAELHVL